MLGKHLLFTDTMQFMFSTLDSLVKNLSKNDFKFLFQEFFREKLQLFKRKAFYA